MDIIHCFILFNVEFLISSFFTYETKKTINYILLSDSLAFIALLIIYETKSNVLSFLVWVFTILILFFTPSRTTMICFLCSTIFPFLRNTKRVLFFIFFTVLISVFFFITNQQNNFLFESNRIIQTDLETDESVNERKDLGKINYDNFKNNWLTGDFMSDIRLFKGEDGYYTHTYFSVWEQFGFFPFMLFLITVCIILYYIYKLYILETDSVFYSILSMTIFTLIAISYARSFHNPFIWFIVARLVPHYYIQLQRGNS